MLVVVVHRGINFKILYLYNDEYCLNIMIIAIIMKVMLQNQIVFSWRHALPGGFDNIVVKFILLEKF